MISMSQTFTLKLATDNLSHDAKEIGVTTEQLLQIKVEVTAYISQQAENECLDNEGLKDNATNACLKLNYEIKLPKKALAESLQWSLWQQNNVAFDDYLWEQTCLECFISMGANRYIEINANPDGRYALYQFENYRQPATLPPVALLQPGSNLRVQIHWLDAHSTQRAIPTDTTHTNMIKTDNYNYRRSLCLPLAQLPYPLAINDKTLIHPCVILYFDQVALYFAPAHAAPADFHQRQHWSVFSHSKH